MNWDEYLEAEDSDLEYIEALGEYFDPDEYEELKAE